MDIILKIIAVLSGLLGSIILIAAAFKSFSHKGMLLAGLSYLSGGVLSIIMTNWWPLAIGIIIAFSIRKKFGEPDYSSESDSNSRETLYEHWCKTYKPLMGVGEPLNYMNI